MSALQDYIDGKNVIRAMFKIDLVGMPTTTEEADEVIEHLEADLSPENLCCDGELSGEPLRIKSKNLNDAYNEAINMRHVLKATRFAS